MVELLLMDETLMDNTALRFTFLEKAVGSWLSAQEGDTKVTKATPRQLFTVFKLIKAEYDERIVREDNQQQRDQNM